MGLFGDWKKIDNWIGRAQKQLGLVSEELIRESGKELVAQLKAKIERQEVEGPPIKEETAKRKGSSLKLIDTGAYKDSFMVRDISIKGGTVTVGPSPEYESLSEWMELGTQRIPARPHIQPALREFNKSLPRRLERMGFEVRSL